MIYDNDETTEVNQSNQQDGNNNTGVNIGRDLLNNHFYTLIHYEKEMQLKVMQNKTGEYFIKLLSAFVFFMAFKFIGETLTSKEEFTAAVLCLITSAGLFLLTLDYAVKLANILLYEKKVSK